MPLAWSLLEGRLGNTGVQNFDNGKGRGRKSCDIYPLSGRNPNPRILDIIRRAIRVVHQNAIINIIRFIEFIDKMVSGVDADYNNGNRAFLQSFIARSTLTFEDAKPILAAIFSAQGMFLAFNHSFAGPYGQH